MKKEGKVKGVNCISQSAKYISPSKTSDSRIAYSADKKSPSKASSNVNTKYP